VLPGAATRRGSVAAFTAAVANAKTDGEIGAIVHRDAAPGSSLVRDEFVEMTEAVEMSASSTPPSTLYCSN